MLFPSVNVRAVVSALDFHKPIAYHWVDSYKMKILNVLNKQTSFSSSRDFPLANLSCLLISHAVKVPCESNVGKLKPSSDLCLELVYTQFQVLGQCHRGYYMRCVGHINICAFKIALFRGMLKNPTDYYWFFWNWFFFFLLYVIWQLHWWNMWLVAIFLMLKAFFLMSMK